MSLRANFKQAINELSGSGAKAETTVGMEDPGDQLLTTYQAVQNNSLTEAAKPEGQKSSSQADEKLRNSQTESTTAVGKQNSEPAVITAETQIHGAIVTKSPLIVKGKVKGNILCEETVRLTGEIEGNVTAMSIEIKGASIKGDLRMKYTAILEEGSKLNGNLEAESAVINGNVNGDMRVHGNLKIMQNSKINGDIFAGSLEIAKGAVISGKVSVASEETSAKKPENAAPIKQNAAEVSKIVPKAAPAAAVVSSAIKS